MKKEIWTIYRNGSKVATRSSFKTALKAVEKVANKKAITKGRFQDHVGMSYIKIVSFNAKAEAFRN